MTAIKSIKSIKPLYTRFSALFRTPKRPQKGAVASCYAGCILVASQVLVVFAKKGLVAIVYLNRPLSKVGLPCTTTCSAHESYTQVYILPWLMFSGAAGTIHLQSSLRRYTLMMRFQSPRDHTAAQKPHSGSEASIQPIDQQPGSSAAVEAVWAEGGAQACGPNRAGRSQ